MTDTQAPAGWYPDAPSGRMRWWDGTAWTEVYAPEVQPSNGTATAALVLGILAIPGLLLVVPALVLGLIAFILGIVGFARGVRVRRGIVPAMIGLWLGAGAFVIGVIVGLFVLGSSASGLKGLPNNGPVQIVPTSSSVVYRVTGDGLANVTYMTVSGSTVGQESANQTALPFSKQIDLKGGFLQYNALTLVAVGDENTTTISCKITKDGEVVAEQTSTGAFAMVTCSAN